MAASALLGGCLPYYYMLAAVLYVHAADQFGTVSAEILSAEAVYAAVGERVSGRWPVGQVVHRGGRRLGAKLYGVWRIDTLPADVDAYFARLAR